VQGGPEPVARPREVGVDGSGPQARVDADEQQIDAIAEQVVDRLAAERVELSPREPLPRRT
jgi:hypothetical protein